MKEIIDLAEGRLPLPAVLVPSEPAKCWNCDLPGQPTWDNRILCPTHFAAEAARLARGAPVNTVREPVTSWEEDLNRLRKFRSDDYQKSREIWAEQDRENATRQEQEAQERDRAEAQYHAARARWIQDGGKL